MRRDVCGILVLIVFCVSAAAALPASAEETVSAPARKPAATAAGSASPAEALTTGATGSAGVATAPTGTMAAPAGGPVLTLQQCIDIALKQNPAISAAGYAVNAANARVGQARSAYYPQVALTGSYDKTKLPSDPANVTQTLYAGNASLTQNIFDFGKTPSQVRIQRLNEDASRSDRQNTVSLVVFGVKQSYYALLQALKTRDVAKETVKLTQDQLDQAKGFFDAGVKSKYDVTSAEVNLSNARLALIRAENAVSVSQVTLKNAMGAPDIPDFTIEDLVQRAYANRPDLQSVFAKREASKESVSLARSGYYPTLSGNANYGRSDDVFVPEKTAWSAGVTLTFPLFNGFLTNYQVREAKENLNAQQANEEALRQSILLDVQQSYLNLRAFEDGVAVAELTAQQAQENYDIVNGRYNAGVGSPLDVTSALVGLSNAKTNYIAALANYKIGEAALLRAIGE
jgi:outer membrane protein